jgi:hypothetical protein
MLVINSSPVCIPLLLIFTYPLSNQLWIRIADCFILTFLQWPQFLRRSPNIISVLLLFSFTCRLSINSGSRTFLNPSGSVQTCIGIALPSLVLFYRAFDSISLSAHWSLPTIPREVTFHTTEIYSVFGKSLCTYKRRWKWRPRASIQAWTRLVLLANTFCRSACEIYFTVVPCILLLSKTYSFFTNGCTIYLFRSTLKFIILSHTKIAPTFFGLTTILTEHIIDLS